MSDNTQRIYERLAAQPEGAALLRRMAITREAILEGIRAAELLDPSLSIVAQAPQPNYSPEVQVAVTELAADRYQTELDHIRAEVEASYGRAA